MCNNLTYLFIGWCVFITLMYIILAFKYSNLKEYSKRITQLEHDLGLKNSLLSMYERRRHMENGTKE